MITHIGVSPLAALFACRSVLAWFTTLFQSVVVPVTKAFIILSYYHWGIHRGDSINVVCSCIVSLQLNWRRMLGWLETIANSQNMNSRRIQISRNLETELKRIKYFCERISVLRLDCNISRSSPSLAEACNLSEIFRMAFCKSSNDSPAIYELSWVPVCSYPSAQCGIRSPGPYWTSAMITRVIYHEPFSTILRRDV